MLRQLQKELSAKDRLTKKKKAVQLKIKPSTDYDTIAKIITDKLVAKIRENLC